MPEAPEGSFLRTRRADSALQRGHRAVYTRLPSGIFYGTVARQTPTAASPCRPGALAIISTQGHETIPIKLRRPPPDVGKDRRLGAAPRSAEGRGKGGSDDATWNKPTRFHA